MQKRRLEDYRQYWKDILQKYGCSFADLKRNNKNADSVMADNFLIN